LAADRGRRPGDDLLSLIAADPDLQRDDIVVTAILIAVAGHETTANLLGTAIVRLLTRRPDGGRLLMTAPATPRGPGPRIAPCAPPANSQFRVAHLMRCIGKTQSSIPTRLTPGMEQSDDPVLAFRPRAYAVSAKRRLSR
jgi:hypothetical protein